MIIQVVPLACTGPNGPVDLIYPPFKSDRNYNIFPVSGGMGGP